jgi:hypothetical protein
MTPRWQRLALLGLTLACLARPASASAQGSTGIITLDPLSQPEVAVRGILRRHGYNPFSFSPAIRTMLRLAPELVTSTVCAYPEVLLDLDVFYDRLDEIVVRALDGERVMRRC